MIFSRRENRVKQRFKRWLPIIDSINSMLPMREKLVCPNCGEKEVDYAYIGNVETRVGYMVVWCGNCNHGIHVSRVKVPENAELIAFEDEEKFKKKVPAVIQYD